MKGDYDGHWSRPARRDVRSWSGEILGLSLEKMEITLRQEFSETAGMMDNES